MVFNPEKHRTRHSRFSTVCQKYNRFYQTILETAEKFLILFFEDTNKEINSIYKEKLNTKIENVI